VIEDLHLLDSETTACLRRLARTISDTGILMLVSGRPEARQLMQRLTQEIITLQPLTKDDLLEIVASIAPDVIGEGELADRIVERSGGVPFLLEQILRAMSRQGASIDAESAQPRTTAQDRLTQNSRTNRWIGLSSDSPTATIPLHSALPAMPIGIKRRCISEVSKFQ
jgi:hypothetical protein